VTASTLPVSLPAQRPSFDELGRRLDGALHQPRDAAYASLVTPWNLAVSMEPAAVVVPEHADDVAATMRFAAQHGLTVGVQATGHGAVSAHAGHILVATRNLDEVTISPAGWARVGAGVKWARVIEAAAPYGFAPLIGSSNDVGVVGYLTGGGVGPMARSFGLSSDRVRAFEVVTGDGVVRRVSASEHPDLFFALRGGKGAAGIVTAVELDLLEMDSFYGGALYFDGGDAAAVLHRWRTWSSQLPEEATTSFALLQLPDLPFVPPPLAGKLTLSVRFVHTGDPQDGERAIAAMRSVAPALIDDVAVKPYAAIDEVHADPVDPMPVMEHSMLLSSCTAETIDALLAVAGPGSASPQVMAEVRQLGGALARPGEYPCALSHRSAAYCVTIVGMAPMPGTAEHAQSALAALGPWQHEGALPNWAPAIDAASARRVYDPATLQRLAEIADAYDPAGVVAGAAGIRAAVAAGV
jgi:hypothetical protein